MSTESPFSTAKGSTAKSSASAKSKGPQKKSKSIIICPICEEQIEQRTSKRWDKMLFTVMGSVDPAGHTKGALDSPGEHSKL